MRQYTILRLLLLTFLLYVAWPVIPEASGQLQVTFWGVWLGFMLLSFGGNLATLLQLSHPPVMEQRTENNKRVREH